MILYPFYSAISSMIIGSGLGVLITQFFASVATSTTLPVITYLSAGLINVLVPADGGHLILQGPIFLPLAEKFGIPTGHVVMAMTIGANWSNMLQPFWALPALALAKLGIRDIMGYCIVVLVVSGVATSILLTVFLAL
jgi:short-chain fatty acids transporter